MSSFPKGKKEGEAENKTDFANKLLEVAASKEAFERWNGEEMSCSGYVGWCIEQLTGELPYDIHKDIWSCHGIVIVCLLILFRPQPDPIK